ADNQERLTLLTGHVDDVLRTDGRAVGVVVDGRAVAAELVIDASGRASRVLRAIRGPGERTDCGAAYAGRQYRLRGTAGPGPVNSFLGLALSFPRYLAVVFLHDNQTFSVTLIHSGDSRLRRL